MTSPDALANDRGALAAAGKEDKRKSGHLCVRGGKVQRLESAEWRVINRSE